MSLSGPYISNIIVYKIVYRIERKNGCILSTNEKNCSIIFLIQKNKIKIIYSSPIYCTAVEVYLFIYFLLLCNWNFTFINTILQFVTKMVIAQIMQCIPVIGFTLPLIGNMAFASLKGYIIQSLTN